MQRVYHKVQRKYYGKTDKYIGGYGTPDEVIELVYDKSHQNHIKDIKKRDLGEAEEYRLHLRS